MRLPTTRRDFLKASCALAAGATVAGLGRGALAAEKLANGAPNATKLGWRLGCQAYSFNRFTFFEAVDKNASLGLRVLEAYPGQKLSAEKPNAQIGPGLSAEDRAVVKKKLADCDIQMVCFGVVGLSKDEKQCREIFDFAKDMGIETVVSEPEFDAFDTIDKLAQEYEINVALHNHPEPSRYWNPDTVLKVCKDRSKRIGACCDTGHWMRSGIKPVEALKKLEGHILSFHFKDLNKFGHSAHDVPWGTGEGHVDELLKEIYRQKIKAPFSIEYEHNWDNSLPEIAKCVEFFDKVAAELAKG
jgi:sugar phosphate isomerase/epimerase